VHAVVGLGNPGIRYQYSRHNVGFRCLDELSRRHDIPLKRRAFQSYVGSGMIGGVPVLLSQPQTYMNLSGEAVHSMLRYYSLTPADLIVVYDDMDLPLGRIRLRERGSSGGHNGMNSIIQHLATQEFPRLRIGIGRPADAEARSHVLSRFSKDEERLAVKAIAVAADAVEVTLKQGVAAAMNTYNSL
jgi:peptidyl-tRNA hydrolase, PTH1 family